MIDIENSNIHTQLYSIITDLNHGRPCYNILLHIRKQTGQTRLIYREALTFKHYTKKDLFQY